VRNHIIGAIAFSSLSLCFGGSSFAQSVNWSGPYFGAFGGYGTGKSTQRDNGIPVAATPAPPAPPPPVVVPPPVVIPPAADGNYSLGGGFGGGLAGYNYQYKQLVIGLEADLAAGGIKGSSGICGTTPHVCGTDIDGMADVRGRLGIAFDRFLPYVAGGLAVNRLHAYDSLFQTSASNWRAGYTIGGGLEYKLTPEISIRAEYLHTGIGSSRMFDIVPGTPERVSARTDAVRVGFSYSFYSVPAPAAVVAKY
jgi:outer membrane immunogenic protein